MNQQLRLDVLDHKSTIRIRKRPSGKPLLPGKTREDNATLYLRASLLRKGLRARRSRDSHRDRVFDKACDSVTKSDGREIEDKSWKRRRDKKGRAQTK